MLNNLPEEFHFSSFYKQKKLAYCFVSLQGLVELPFHCLVSFRILKYDRLLVVGCSVPALVFLLIYSSCHEYL